MLFCTGEYRVIGGMGLLLLALLVVSLPAEANRKIALTYDDAPRVDGAVFTGTVRAEKLIAALARVEAGPVAFFVTTNGLERSAANQQRIARYAEAGHLIANHTHTHQWAHKTQAEDFLTDVDRAEQLLAGFDNRRPWFRFPYLDEGRRSAQIEALRNGLAKRGLQNGYVTVDNYDWHIEQQLQRAVRSGVAVDYDKLGQLYVQMMLYSAEFYDAIAVQQLGYSPVHVLLLHENDLAALYADKLVLALRATGWEVVSPDAAYDDPLPQPKSRHLSQGRVFALADDAGRHRSTMWSWTIDEAMIDVWLERSGVFGGEE